LSIGSDCHNLHLTDRDHYKRSLELLEKANIDLCKNMFNI